VAARVRKLEASKVKKATKRELIVVATMISRMIGTPVFSDRTEYSVTTGRACRLNHLEKHCRRNVEAVTKLFHLPSVQLPLFLQNQGHNTLAAQVVCKVLLSESVGIHQFS
jgi:hypothetical protein